jgi:hypothetical protein
MDELEEVVAQVVRLREELKPPEVYDAHGEHMPGDWLAVTHSVTPYHGRVPLERWILYLVDDRGNVGHVEQFDTLEIALDQAHSIFGVERDEWRETHVVIEDGPVGHLMPWSSVA